MMLNLCEACNAFCRHRPDHYRADYRREYKRREASTAAAIYYSNLPEHTSKLEETYEAEGGQVSRRRQQQFRIVQRDAHPLETRLEHGTRQLRLLPNEQRFYL